MDNTVLNIFGTSIQTIFDNLVTVMGTVIVIGIGILGMVMIVHRAVVIFKQIAFSRSFNDRYEWHDNGMGGGHYTLK